jgi:hypothetical protein
MDRSYFNSGLSGDPRMLPDDKTRARWLVAEALRTIAKGEERSMAARIRIAAGDIENGIMPSKKVLDKIQNKRLEDSFKIFSKLCHERIQNQK